MSGMREYKMWTQEERDFLLENWETMTRMEMAKKLGRTPSSLRSQHEWLVLKNGGMEEGEGLATHKKPVHKGGAKTICDYCRHAYGDDCFSVPFEERAWVQKATMREITYTESPYFIHEVERCSRFAVGRKPLNTFSAMGEVLREEVFAI